MELQTKLDKRVFSIKYRYHKAADKIRYKCLYSGCNSTAIRSHLLQKNGVLDSISEDNHIYQVICDPYEKNIYSFKRTGNGEPCTFKIFCSTHDNSLFGEIEKRGVDFNNYRSKLLFSYRGLLGEMSKYRCNLYAAKQELNDRHLIDLLGKEHLSYKQKLWEILLEEAQFYKEQFEGAIGDESLRPFIFEHFRLPKIPVYTSTVFVDHNGVGLAAGRHNGDFKYLNNVPIGFPPCIYINLLPYKNETILILGYHFEDKDRLSNLIKSYSTMSREDLLKALSDILIKSIETWYCSAEFFERNIKPRERMILSAKEKMADPALSSDVIISIRNADLNFNIFNVEDN